MIYNALWGLSPHYQISKYVDAIYLYNHYAAPCKNDKHKLRYIILFMFWQDLLVEHVVRMEYGKVAPPPTSAGDREAGRTTQIVTHQRFWPYITRSMWTKIRGAHFEDRWHHSCPQIMVNRLQTRTRSCLNINNIKF